MLSFKDMTEQEEPEVILQDKSIKEQYHTHLNNTYTPNEDQWTRFSSIMPTTLRQATIVIIGVGGIGYKLLRQLAGIGIKNIHIFDMDIIDTHNVGPQGYAWHQVGEKKVKAAADNIFNDFGINIFTYDKKVTCYNDITLNVTTPTIVCCCVDNMEIRKVLAEELIFSIPNADYLEKVRHIPQYYIDTRMSLGTWTIYTFPLNIMSDLLSNFGNTYEAVEYFRKEGIFTDEEGVQEPCTAREINFTGEAISAKVVSSLMYLFNSDTKLNGEGRIESFFTLEDNLVRHKWLHSFDSLAWESITPTIKDKKNEETISNITLDFMNLVEYISNIISVALPPDDVARIDSIRELFNSDDLNNSIQISDEVMEDIKDKLYHAMYYIEESDSIIHYNTPKVDEVELENILLDKVRKQKIKELMELQSIQVEVGDQIKFVYKGLTELNGWFTVASITLTQDNNDIVLHFSTRAVRLGEITIKYLRSSNLDNNTIIGSREYDSLNMRRDGGVAGSRSNSNPPGTNRLEEVLPDSLPF